MAPTEDPHEDTLDAWLAGELSLDERKAVEKSLAAPDDDETEELLHDLDRLRTRCKPRTRSHPR